ncbi:hypothetical protein Tcan_11614 [Toxocara canis]|uniref:Ubiquitin-like domain-containing protein n=1 Tax=Toxocara canis TaxID=6265 RepID=A0A0B2VTV3_TOXCA|nr:hypothetical protein Tcan_11614 [Toxocara canis]
MLLFIKNEKGTALSIDVESTDTVLQLLKEVLKEEGFKTSDINKAKLVFKGETMEPIRPLNYYNVQECSIINVKAASS